MKKEEADLLFRVNDIRAIYGSQLKDQHAYAIGRAFASYIKSDTILVGHDMRTSSPALAKAFISGILDQGTNVILLGLIDTPGLYFATSFFNLPGAMITASHNPAIYNGIKLCRPQAKPINDRTGLLSIKNKAISEKFESTKKGVLLEKNISQQYKNHVLSFVNLSNLRPLSAIIDAGNGMAGSVVPLIYKNLPLSIMPLYFELDGTFPRHVPNPAIPENLFDVSNAVKQSRVDFGMAFDGDCDRIFFIDELGRPLSSSVTAAIIIDYLKVKKVVYSSTCSKIIAETVNNAKGKSYMDKVGHSFIKERMKKENADFGVEESGHFYYKNNFYADSAIITSLIMYEIISKSNIPLSQIAAPYRKYYKLDEASFDVKDRKKTLKVLESFLKRKKPKKISKIDGIKAEFPSYWISVRAGNTEPLVRINLEATTSVIALQKFKEISKLIKQ